MVDPSWSLLVALLLLHPRATRRRCRAVAGQSHGCPKGLVQIGGVDFMQHLLPQECRATRFSDERLGQYCGALQNVSGKGILQNESG